MSGCQTVLLKLPHQNFPLRSLSTSTPTSTCNRFCEQGGFARTGALEAIFCLQTNYAPGEGERKPVLQKVSW